MSGEHGQHLCLDHCVCTSAQAEQDICTLQGVHGWDVLRACNAVKKAAQDSAFEAGVKAAAAIHKRASRVSPTASLCKVLLPDILLALLQHSHAFQRKGALGVVTWSAVWLSSSQLKQTCLY